MTSVAIDIRLLDNISGISDIDIRLLDNISVVLKSNYFAI